MSGAGSNLLAGSRVLTARNHPDHQWVDLIGSYTIKAEDKTIMDFMCLTMIDPVTSWFEIVELPNKDITYIRDEDKQEIKEVIMCV